MSQPAKSALRALRTLPSSTPSQSRNMSMQTVANFNRTMARSSLKDSFNTFRSAFKQQTRRQTADTTAAEPELTGFAKFWNSPVGPKTVHFWAPIAKWGVVLAGVSDMFRPPEVLSLQQNLALTATGAIWTRWCFIIKPRNLFLATVNFFLFCNGATQTTRVLMWRSQQNADTLGSELKSAAKEEGQVINGVVEHPGQAVKRAEERTS